MSRKNIKNWNEYIKENYKHGFDKVAGKPIVPPRYVYHISDKSNRDSILKYGLKPMVGDSYKSWTQSWDSIP